MNKRPVTYLQTDKRWKSIPYQVKGETATIGGSGCGPSAAAMILTSMTGQIITPVDTCKWSVDHGYKALNAGTYYSYFVPQFKAYGIECVQLSQKSLHNEPQSNLHDFVKHKVHEEGYYAIALMGKGTWTSGGHYIVVWDWDDKVRINDSASTKDKRLNGDPETFKREVKQYWLIDARDYNKEDDWMDNYEKWKEYMARYEAEQAEKPVPVWAQNNGEWEAAKKAGIVTASTKPQALCTKAEAAAFALRAAKD